MRLTVLGLCAVISRHDQVPRRVVVVFAVVVSQVASAPATSTWVDECSCLIVPVEASPDGRLATLVATAHTVVDLTPDRVTARLWMASHAAWLVWDDEGGGGGGGAGLASIAPGSDLIAVCNAVIDLGYRYKTGTAE